MISNYQATSNREQPFATERERFIAMDIQIRTEQGEARRLADEALRAEGRCFVSRCVSQLPHWSELRPHVSPESSVNTSFATVKGEGH